MPSAKPARQHHVSSRLRGLLVPLTELSADPANLRLHPERSIEALKASLRRFGQQKPVVYDERGIVVAGNGTLEAARALGWSHVAAVKSDLAGVERTAYSIADNRTAELSSWDHDALQRMAAELGPEEMAALGFADGELEALAAQAPAPDVIQDDVPLPPDEATTQLGDLITLGRHRLLCGDSAKAKDLDRLLGGVPVHLVNTDPPYNVKVEPRSNNAIVAGLSSFPLNGGKDADHHDQQKADINRYPEKGKATHKKLRAKDRPLANDFLPDAEFEKLLAAWFGNIARVLIPGGGFYIWGGYANCANYPPVLKACELYFSQAVIWVKEHPVLTRKDFMGNHEWCFYGWKLGAAHRFFGPANVPDTWSVKKVNPQSMVHLTEKPVELAARALQYSSKAGENVLDLFGGSGSTMMAAEQSDRRAFSMELDPLYCDVIVERWEKFTGKKAERPTRRPKRSPAAVVA